MDHAVIILDEAYYNAEARRSMRNENFQLDYFVRQSRKKGVKLFFTTQTIDILDRRLRASAKRIFNVWNPDGCMVSTPTQTLVQLSGTGHI